MDNYRVLYKAGKAQKLPAEKRQVAIREQKRRREDTFLGRRNIVEDEGPASAAPSPAPKLQETRREKLLRWKAEKDKLLAQQKIAEKKRPPFKVGVAHHAIDPNKELTETTVKCATLRKAAKQVRSTATATRKAPTEAASSLAALADPAPVRSAAFSGRVTRSRTAAAAVSKVPDSKAKKVLPSSSENTKKTQSTSARNTKASTVSSTRGSKVTVAASSKVEKVPQKSVKTSKASIKDLETSFAPQNHKFKAPVSLTLPTTPITLKRKAAGFKEANWPHIPGIGILNSSPEGPSPKVLKIAASERRGRLSRAVKDKTPKASPKVSKVSLKEKTPKNSPKVSKGVLKGKTPKKSPKVPTTTVQGKTPKKSPKATKFTGAEKTPKKSPLVPESLNVESAGSSNMSRSGRRSGMFVVTDMPEKTPSKAMVVQESAHLEETLPKPSTPSQGSSRKSTGSKRRQSMREKENVPAEAAILENCPAEETISPSLPVIDEMDSVILSSRRMSIHEPSPVVHVSPENLSSGMVPAQFSPFITSARGKDKYSTQKRRSSLIPMVQELSPEELVKCRQTEHFRNLLERESSRLLTLSSLWEERKSEAPAVIQDKILGPVGQARLLVKDKFQQFKRLVDKFEAGLSEEKITSDDLTGFWEMMMLTVENVDKRFKELDDLKENNWEEKEPEKPVKKNLPVAASKATKPKTQAQSRLKELIENARRKKQEAKQNKSSNTSTVSVPTDAVATFDGGFFRIESPKKVVPSPVASPVPRSPQVKPTTPYQLSRRSLLQQVLTHSAVRAVQSPAASPLNKSLTLSPSPKVVAAQLRASQIGKRMSMDTTDVFNQSPSSPVLKAEPTKSILKSAARKSLRINTPRNRVAFDVLNHSANASLGSPTLLSPAGTPQSKIPMNKRMSTPGSRKRTSLIPRPITPKDRPSLLPVRESLMPTKPLSNGELIDFDSPKRISFA